MNRYFSTVFVISAVYSVVQPANLKKDGCIIDINEDLTSPQPLILNPQLGTDSNAFILPIDGVIKFQNNDQLLLSCPKSSLEVNEKPIFQTELISTCNNGKFSISGEYVSFSLITCTKETYNIAKYNGRKCANNKQEIDIGFSVGKNNFIKLLTSCFDTANHTVLYTYFNLTKHIDGFQHSFPRPGFIQGSFYSNLGTSVNSLYTRKKQRQTINQLLGLEPSSDKYIAASGDYYLARGHLTAKADFIFGSQQRTTFYYVNVVPQWQTFNGGNWNSIEQSVRELAIERELNLVVYTGGYGLATLPHEESGKNIPLYLYVQGTKRGVPVPKLFWKIVRDPIAKAAIVLIGLNNPYKTDISQDIICSDICDQVDWLTWNRDDVKLGYGYCCSYPDFKKVVGDVPDFPVDHVLV